MEKFYQYWDIIALGLIIIFLIIIFIRVIGKNLGLQKNQNVELSNSMLSNVRPVIRDAIDKKELPKHKIERYAEGSLNAKIEKVKKYDSHFTLKEFINNCKNSFKEIVINYNKNNLEKIKNLLNPEIYEIFNKGLEKNITLRSNIEIEKFLIADVVDVNFKNSLIIIDVNFLTKQKVTNNSYEVREIWSFIKNKKSEDNVWKLYKVSTA